MSKNGKGSKYGKNGLWRGIKPERVGIYAKAERRKDGELRVLGSELRVLSICFLKSHTLKRNCRGVPVCASEIFYAVAEYPNQNGQVFILSPKLKTFG